MKKIITKHKKTGVKSLPAVNALSAVNTLSISRLIKYNFLFGGMTVFLGLIFFFVMLAFFFNNLVSAYLIRENILHPAVKEYIWRAVPSESLPALESADKEFMPAGPFPWQENEIMALPDDIENISSLNFLSSPDGSQFAYVSKSNNQSSVSLNGIAGPLYDKIIFMIFSPDSRHFAYGIKTGEGEAVVIDGELQVTYDWIFPPYFFTPDSRHFVYKVRDGDDNFLIFDNQAGEAYDQIYNQFMSDDEKTLIYYAKKDRKIYKNTLELGE